MKIKRMILKWMPNGILKLLYVLTKKQAFIRILMRKILKSDNLESVIEKRLLSGKMIEINESTNNYAALNMCYVNDMLGETLYALSLGYIPSFKIAYYNMPETNIWNDFFSLGGVNVVMY